MIRTRGDTLKAVAVIAPSFAAILVFVYGFILWTLRTSLSRWDGILPDFTFVGLANYAALFATERFQIDMRNTLFFTVAFLAVTICGGLALALLIDSRIKAEGLFRSVFLFPMAISFVVTGVVWRWIFNPRVGVNALLARLGLNAQWGWYTDPSAYGGFHVALIPVVIAASWQLSGYTMAMFLAGLRGIPEELLEASRIDGAGAAGTFWYVVLPLLRPITLSAMIVLGHISLKIFDLVYTMTGSGPAFATDVPAIYMFETTFRGNHYSRGAVISMVMLLLVAIVIVPYLLSTFRREKGGH